MTEDDVADLKNDHALMLAFLNTVLTDWYPLSPERTLAVGNIKRQRDKWRLLAQETAGRLRFIGANNDRTTAR